MHMQTHRHTQARTLLLQERQEETPPGLETLPSPTLDLSSPLSHKRRQEDSSLVIKDKVLSWTKAFLCAGLFANNGMYSQSYGFSNSHVHI